MIGDSRTSRPEARRPANGVVRRRLPPRLGCVGLVLAGCLTAPAHASAQAPWTVTLTPTLNPLPIGSCAAVHLQLYDPAAKDVPRNPQGQRVTMADFDLAVSAPDGASSAGQYNGANHFTACGCQGASPGTVATVTATYPAQGLAAAERVQAVAFQKTATFTLAPPNGTHNPPSCSNIAPPPVVASTTGGTPPATQPPPAAVAQPPVTSPPPAVATVATTPVPVATTPVAATPVTLTPVTTTPSVAAGTVAANGGTAGVGGSASALNGSAGPGSTTTGTDTPSKFAIGNAVTGSAATSAAAGGAAGGGAATPPGAAAPVPVNPSWFTGVETAPGQVQLSWQPVPGASYYVLWGPGLPGISTSTLNIGGGAKVSGATTFTATAVPAGSQRWAVASYYEPGPVFTGGEAQPKVTVNVTAPVASGRYLITVTGLRCFWMSADDLLSRDGIGDEVFAAAYVRRYNRQTGQIAEFVSRKTMPYGDVFYFGGQRLQGGSKSAFGGIQDGDMIPDGPMVAMRSAPAQEVAFPWKLWEGTLTDGADALVITPSLWEQDAGNAYYAQWAQQQQTLNLSLFTSQAVQSQITQKAFGPLAAGATGNSSNAIPGAVAGLLNDIALTTAFGVPLITLLSTSYDRPLGLVASGRDMTALPNRAVVLTREIIETALARPPLGTIPSPFPALPPGSISTMAPMARIGTAAPLPGVIMIEFFDGLMPGFAGFPERPAKYQMFIQVERVP